MSNRCSLLGPGPPYIRYLDKNDFRLIRLHPGDWNAPLICELFIGKPENAPKYEALSWVWGSQFVTRSILVDDVEMQIAVNLDTALRHLRRENAKVVLWVDALVCEFHLKSHIYVRSYLAKTYIS